jgi:hypothetical protein
MNAPCRVSVDLALHESEPHVPDTFDEYDEMKVGAVVPYELVSPVQGLLMWRSALRRLPETELSREILIDLDKLYKACRERYADL